MTTQADRRGAAMSNMMMNKWMKIKEAMISFPDGDQGCRGG